MYKNYMRTALLRCPYSCFNPCFNGTMYKNILCFIGEYEIYVVSILVLMDLCIKTWPAILLINWQSLCFNPCFNGSMYKNEYFDREKNFVFRCFNPCFNGSMYKNKDTLKSRKLKIICFNPCFNGSMYKNYFSNKEK